MQAESMPGPTKRERILTLAPVEGVRAVRRTDWLVGREEMSLCGEREEDEEELVGEREGEGDTQPR